MSISASTVTDLHKLSKILKEYTSFLAGENKELKYVIFIRICLSNSSFADGQEDIFFYPRNPVELQETPACQTGFQFATPWQPVWRARRPSSRFSWWISVLVDPRVPVKVGNEQLFHLISSLLSFTP